jgi:hypothetical protein
MQSYKIIKKTLILYYKNYLCCSEERKKHVQDALNLSGLSMFDKAGRYYRPDKCISF